MRRIVPIVVLVLAACSEDRGPVRRAATARIVNGATAEAPAATPAPTVAGDAILAANIPVEHYTISPDKVKATLLAISFEPHVNNEGESPLPNCEVTYDRAAASLSTRLECPFEVTEGTYTRMKLRFSKKFQVLVDDAVNNLYTDPSAALGLASSRPAGGAQFIDYQIVCVSTPCSAVDGVVDVAFTEPLVVGADPLQLTVVMHGLHTMAIERIQGVFQEKDWRTDVPLFLVPSVTGVASVDFYSSYGSGRTFNSTAGATAPPLVDFFVFHDQQGPTFLGLLNRIAAPGSALESCYKTPAGKQVGSYVQNTAPTVMPDIEPQFRPGGYLGRDASGVIAWTMSADGYGVSQYSLWRMQGVTTPGGSTTLSCLVTASPPVPTSGNTYSSGAPAMPVPTASISMRLVTR